MKDSAKTLSSICMFWAFAPKRYKGKNIFGFDSTFCGDCLGKGQMNIIVQVLPDIFEFGEFVGVSFIDFEALLGDKKGLKRCLTTPFSSLRQRKRLKVSPNSAIESK